MSAPAAEVTGAAGGAPGAQPAQGAPPPPKTFGEIMAKIRGRAQQEPPRDAATPPPPATKVEIPGDDVSLKRITKLEADNLAARERIAQLETAEKDAALLRDVRKLYGEGKKMEAIGMLAGADPSGELEELLASYLEADKGTPAAATAEAALAAKVDEALQAGKKAQEAVETLRKEDAAKADKEDRNNRLGFALQALDGAKNDDGSPQFELCSRQENRGDLEKLLFGYADDKGVEQVGHVQRLAVKQGVKSEDVTPDLARKLILAAYADIETELEAEGLEQQKAIDARYKKAAREQPRQGPNPQRVTPPVTGSAQEPQREPQPRPMQKPPVRVAETKPAHSLDAVMARNRERARY